MLPCALTGRALRVKLLRGPRLLPGRTVSTLKGLQFCLGVLDCGSLCLVEVDSEKDCWAAFCFEGAKEEDGFGIASFGGSLDTT